MQRHIRLVRPICQTIRRHSGFKSIPKRTGSCLSLRHYQSTVVTDLPRNPTAQALNPEVREPLRESERLKSDIIQFLYENNQRPIPTGKKNVILCNCPHCLKVRKQSFTAYINLQNGSYECQTCRTSGKWQQFKTALRKKLNPEGHDAFSIFSPTTMIGGSATQFSRPLEEIKNYPNALTQRADILQKLSADYKLDDHVLRLYGVGVATYPDTDARLAQLNQDLQPADLPSALCLTFPQTTLTYDYKQNTSTENSTDGFRIETVRIKACSLDNPTNVIVMDPPVSNEALSAGLFGYQTVSTDAKTVILTRRELDAMAAYQATGIPSLALPSQNYQLQESVLPLLERFSRIYLWLDDDVDGHIAAERFSQKLGASRCLIVHTRDGDLDGPVSAHEAWMKDKDLKQLLRSARQQKHEQILDFGDLRAEVHREVLHPDQICGVQSTELLEMNAILKGHRPGELTILTGPTGVGKTTIISQLSLDYCRSGVPTLWGSFEIPNRRLAKKMLYQFAGKNLSEHPHEFDIWADKFQQLPLYFLKFFSSTAIKDVLTACSHAVHAYDVRHIVLDNLQFMLSQQGRSSLDRWELQDNAVAELRNFATQQDVHISLVVHPRKDSGEALDINSVFGSAKVTQEADNVIIIQKRPDSDLRYLDIKKNRFDGTLGSIPFKFNKDTLKITSYTEEELIELKKKTARRTYTVTQNYGKPTKYK